ncbi:hypothetical protein [Sulfitobacter sp. 20_GPM-1509m]|uniref:hypothetical protein n=1 Tax=Sulfitobacter sp. 20_GPM-1509m TaxID=1380367 RepID=UPI00056A944D|nr:hypothetical protein [Sulfitobacter sp. 20_GPM-1509m]
MDNAQAVSVKYTNWLGETAVRRLILGDVRYGTTDWHQQETWLISAFDLDHPAQIWKEFDLTKMDFTCAMQPSPSEAAIEWAVGKWRDEVKNRPLQNVHRRALDDTWRTVMRHFGGDPDELVGPSHDALRAIAGEGQ